ncbi:hypothetical protein OIO90_002957 [Microbotryomycetes sp. JL221]|nr:hypothetical protein OIO90_002957 [Microbotryomycetes sp. JL221]
MPSGSFSFSSSSPSSQVNGNGTPNKKRNSFKVPSDEDDETTKMEDLSMKDSDSSDDDSNDSDSSVEIIEPKDMSPRQKQQLAQSKKQQGNELYKQKKYIEATRLYTQAIELDSQEPSYYMNRAASRMESKSFRLALEDLLVAVGLQRNQPQSKTLLRLGKCQMALGMVVPAQQSLDEAFKLEPSNPQIQQERARVGRIGSHVQSIQKYINSKDWSMVLLGVDAAAREVDETPREWKSWKVQALVGKKRYEEASSIAADLLRQDQNQPDALYYRGLALYYSGNQAQAIAHMQSALRNDPDFGLARTLLKKIRLLDSTKDSGNEAFKAGRLDDAVAKYTEALAIDEDNDAINATLLSNRATAYLKLKNYDQALADCNSCLELDESYFKAYRTRARTYVGLEQFEQAVQDMEKAFELAPSGSNDERALKNEVQDVKAKLKRSKMKDHYKILGVSSDATEIEIKKAYRKQSLLHHPDKGGSEDKFKEIGLSYAILSDPERRRKFDMGVDESDPSSGMESNPFGGGVDLSDLFGGGGFGHSHGFGGGGFGGGFGGAGFGGGQRGGFSSYGF